MACVRTGLFQSGQDLHDAVGVIGFLVNTLPLNRLRSVALLVAIGFLRH
jgi:hypothetical protein